MWITEYNENLDRNEIGGKALHLFHLKNWGANVPRFGVVSTETFKQWQRTGQIPEGLIQEITQEINRWGVKYFAVRSSMTAEDGAKNSYAGVMETFLYVEAHDVPEKIIECFRSAFSERAEMYRSARGDGDLTLGAAVVVQSMVPSQVSGVAFSRAPSGNSALVFVESGYGLGEGVVSGLVDVDQYWWDRFGNELRRNVRQKTSQLNYVREKASVCEVPVLSEKQNESTLSDDELFRLTKEVVRLEDRLGKPADIEWSVVDGEIFILQVRPITQEVSDLGYYADTNLCESYPGLTSPFTADFVAQMYTKVFKEAGGILGFFSGKRKILDPINEDLIRNFGGHLYYHLNYYYVALCALPGGKKNLESWHRMIGGKVQISVPTPELPEDSFLQKWNTYFSILKLVFFHKRLIKNFLKASETQANQLELEIQNSDSPQKTAQNILNFIDSTKGWGLTALNDVLVMSGLKALTKLAQKNGYLEEDVIALLKTEDGVESLGPLEALRDLAKDLEEDIPSRQFLEKLRDEGGEEIQNPWQRLREAGFVPLAQKIEKFLTQWGDRSFEELKLESLTFRQSPRSFLKLLLWEVQNRSVGASMKEGAGSPRREVLLRGKEKILFNWLVSFTRKTVAARESTRLMRGRFFGLVREGLLKIFSQLQETYSELREVPRLAVFGVSMEDLRKLAEGRQSSKEMVQLIVESSGWEKVKIAYPEFVAQGYREESPVYFLDQELFVGDRVLKDELQGDGASPGIAQGLALVLTDPREALEIPDLHNYILVTRSTDPAWIFIMSRCLGLVAEKGSLLSHTAIVGRELGIPTVVGVKEAVTQIQTGQEIQIDGKLGRVRKIQSLRETSLDNIQK